MKDQSMLGVGGDMYLRHTASRLGAEQGCLGQDVSALWGGGRQCACRAAIPALLHRDTPAAPGLRHGSRALPSPSPAFLLPALLPPVERGLQSSLPTEAACDIEAVQARWEPQKSFGSRTQTLGPSGSISPVWPWASGRLSEPQCLHL